MEINGMQTFYQGFAGDNFAVFILVDTKKENSGTYRRVLHDM
jgi:hypothetical protein